MIKIRVRHIRSTHIVSITLFYYLFGKHLLALPLYARTFLLTVSLIPWMMFVGVPLVDSLLGQLSLKDNKKGKM
jgi:antibiotic biosynthesis monooxygenase (ABM) superfamily enzyme